MKVSVLGFDGPLARETRAVLERRGHTLADTDRDCAIYFPGPLDELLEQAGAEGRSSVDSWCAATPSPTRVG